MYWPSRSSSSVGGVASISAAKRSASSTGSIAERPRRFEIPPPPSVVGDAEDDREPQVGCLQAGVDEPDRVAGRQPQRQLTTVVWTRPKGADAQAGDREAVTVVIQAAQRLGCSLAESVVRIGPDPGVSRHHRRSRRESDGVVAARVHDAADPEAQSAFEHPMGQAEMAVQRFGERALTRIGGEMDDGVGAVEKTFQGSVIRTEVGDDHAIRPRGFWDARHRVH